MFLSTPHSRVATLEVTTNPTAKAVSIHATLAGGDTVLRYDKPAANVSIHATLAGGDV